MNSCCFALVWFFGILGFVRVSEISGLALVFSPFHPSLLLSATNPQCTEDTLVDEERGFCAYGWDTTALPPATFPLRMWGRPPLPSLGQVSVEGKLLLTMSGAMFLGSKKNRHPLAISFHPS